MVHLRSRQACANGNIPASLPALLRVFLVLLQVSAVWLPAQADATPVSAAETSAPFTWTIPADEPVQLIPTADLESDEPPETTQVAAAQDWAYDPTSTYDQKGLDGTRGFAANSPRELIDPFSGNLLLYHTDFHLPGIAGLDLTLQRIYNSKIHRNYAARASGNAARIAQGMRFVPITPLGLGWSMHLGRLIGFDDVSPNNMLSRPRYYEKSDGSQHPYFRYTGQGCGDEVDDVCFLTRDRDNPYRDSPEDPWRIATADSLNITFDHAAPTEDGVPIYYATEIRDVHGNRIQIFYHDNTITGIDTPNEYYRHFIDYIIDSAERRIDFGYSEVNPGVVRLTSIQAVNRTMTYAYTGDTPWPAQHAFLASVQPPEGAPWQYAYAGLAGGDCGANDKRWCELTQITYPTGGVTTYAYEELTFWAHTNPMAVRALVRKETGGRSVTPGLWTYAYNRGAQYEGDEHTVVTRPDDSQIVYTYFGIAQSAYSPLGNAWKAGVLLQKQTRNEDGTVVETEMYDWVAAPSISAEIWGDPWIGFDNGVRMARLYRRVVRRGNLTWTTTHTSYNDSVNAPRCTTEQGDGAIRYRVHAYSSKPDIVQLGRYKFRIRGLDALEAMSYQPFSGAVCDDDQEAGFSPLPEDEFRTNTFNALGQLSSQIDNLVYREFRYHADGSLQAEILFQDRLESGDWTNGYCTTYTDYAYGFPQTIGYGAPAPACNAPLYSTQQTISLDGTPAGTTDGEGNTTNFTFDGLARLVGITRPGEAPILVTYDGSANSPQTYRRVSQGPSWIEVTLDGYGRKLATNMAGEMRVHQEYDALGRVRFRSLPHSDAASPAANIGETIVYDALARIVQQTQADGTIVTYTYGEDAHTVTVTDEMERATIQTRRSFGAPNDYWLIHVQRPGKSAAQADTYQYLVGGHLTEATVDGMQHSFRYNYQKLVVEALNPETGLRTYYGYDAAGNMRCRTHGLPQTCGGVVYTGNAEVLFEVDGLGRVTQLHYNDSTGTSIPAITFTYDDANNITAISDSVGAHTFDFNAANRLERRSSTVDGVQYITEYTYDNRGNIEKIRYPSGREVGYDYDDANRLIQVQGFVDGIDYHPGGLMRRIRYANGVETQLTLDSRQRPHTLGAAGVFDLEYTYDEVGNVTRLADGIDGDHSMDFTFDELDRLTGASGVWGSLAYTYNGAGRRVGDSVNGQTATYTYDSLGQLAALEGRVELAFNYDSRGNVVRRGSYGYIYDLENRITAVRDAQQRTVATYVYDGLGHRMVATHAPCAAHVIYHHNQEGQRIAESTASGIMLAEYIVAQGRTVAKLDLNPLRTANGPIDLGDVEIDTVITHTVTLTNRSDLPLQLEDLVSHGDQIEVQTQLPVMIPAHSTVQQPIGFTAVQTGTVATTLGLCGADGLQAVVQVQGAAKEPLGAQSTPQNGANNGPANQVAVTYPQEVAPTSVTPRSFAVHAMQTGQILTGLAVHGRSVVVAPALPFKAGELIQVSATGAIQYAAGGAQAEPLVWQFYVQPRKVGGGNFENSATNRASTVWPAQANRVIVGAVRLGDLDRDGDLDAFVAIIANDNEGNQANQVWLNNGSGQLTDSGQRLGSRWSEDVALGDVDGDGDLDAYVANSGTNALGTDRAGTVWLNDGNGRFSDSGQLLGNGESRRVALGDLDGDGDLDAFVANSDVIVVPSYRPANVIWLNDGNGVFTRAGQSLGSSRSMDVALGDVDGDGDLDALVANLLTGNRTQVWLNQGDASFRSGQALDRLHDQVLMGDLNGDGTLDVLLDRWVLLNDGVGNFTEIGSIDGGMPRALGDVDGDGDLDAFGSTPSGDALWRNNGEADFVNSGQSLGEAVHLQAVLGDVDGDGDLDVVHLPAEMRLNSGGTDRGPELEQFPAGFLPLIIQD